MIYGRTPFNDVPHISMKMAKLCNPNQVIDYPSIPGTYFIIKQFRNSYYNVTSIYRNPSSVIACDEMVSYFRSEEKTDSPTANRPSVHQQSGNEREQYPQYTNSDTDFVEN